MILAICLSLTLFQARSAAFSKPITLDETCIGTKALMQKLSEQSGLKLTAIDDILNDDLAIRCHAVQLSELMKRLAEAESGEWQERDRGYRFTRCETTLNAERKAKLDGRLRLFGKSISKYRVKLSESPTFDEASASKLAEEIKAQEKLRIPSFDRAGFQQRQDLYLALPMARALSRILFDFPLQQVASLQAKQRLLFSSNPTKMEQPLPEYVSPIIEDLIREQHIWHAVANSGFEGNDGLSQNSESLGPATRVVLQFQYMNEYSGTSVSLYLLNAKSQVLGFEQLNLGSLPELDEPSLASAISFARRQPIDLTPSEDEAATYFARDISMAQVDRSTISPGLRAALLHPEATPLSSLFAGPILEKVATQRQENLIAVLGERLIYGIAVKVAKHQFPGNGIDALRSPLTGGSVTDKDGWLTVRPVSFDDAAKGRINPAALAVLVAKANDEARISLDDLAAFALASTSESVNQTPMASLYLDAFLDKGHSNLSSNDFNALQLYGTLTPIQKSDAGQGIPLGQLSNFQLGLIRSMAFAAGSGLIVSSSVPAKADAPATLHDFARIPEELLPNDLSADGSFTMKGVSADILLAHMQNNGQDLGTQAITPAFIVQVPNLTYLSFQPANAVDVDLKFQLSRTVRLSRHLEVLNGRGGIVKSFSKLPKIFEDQYKVALENVMRDGAPSHSGTTGLGEGDGAPPH